MPYISAGVIPEKGKNRWRIPGKEAAPEPGKDEFVVFLSFLDGGLAFPTSSYFHHFLSFYRIKISDLGPHSIQQISFFVTLYEGYLGCPPYFPLWLSIFHECVRRMAGNWSTVEGSPSKSREVKISLVSASLAKWKALGDVNGST
jgi:hypothetical protein